MEQTTFDIKRKENHRGNCNVFDCFGKHYITYDENKFASLTEEVYNQGIMPLNIRFSNTVLYHI